MTKVSFAGFGKTTVWARRNNVVGKQIQDFLEADVLDNAPAIIALHDLDHNIVWANKAYLKVGGWSLQDVVGKKCHTIWEVDDFCDNCPVRKAIETGEPRDAELTLQSGERFSDSKSTTLVRVAPVKDRDSNIIGVVEVAFDITERKRVEDALNEGQEMLRMHSGQSLMGVIILQDDLFVFANDRAAEIMEVSTEEIASWSPGKYAELIHPDDRAFVMEQGQKKQLGEDGAIINYSWRMITPGGRSKWIEMWSRSGSFDGRTADIVMMIDITKRKQAEAEKARIEDQYSQIQKIESIGRLAGGVAHDLNNLLSPILGYGEMLMDEFSPDDERLESVSEIVRAGLRARDLVRQLLVFSRKQPLERKPQNLNGILEGIHKLLRRTIRKDVQIEIITSPDIKSISADLRQIEQVIINLSINAQDAMPEGGTLTLETAMDEFDKNYVEGHPGAQVGEYIRLTVSDTGCGMDGETQENIFEPFFTTKGDGGTGLGLANVYGIVKQHGGSIQVESEPGKGAVFMIYLPASDEPFVETMNQEIPSEDLRGSETILLVDDNIQVLKLTRIILEKKGYSVLEAESGNDALTLLASPEGSVQLLLTDLIMPRMNGRDLFLKATMSHPDLKVLYMSGCPDEVTVLCEALEGDIPLIQKPFTVQGLATKVREVLDA